MLSLREHAFYEYSLGGVLLLSPLVFGFTDLDIARTVFFSVGAALILFALLEDDVHSWRRLIPAPVLMGLDVVAAAVLVTAPWLGNYRVFLTPGQEWLHYLIGVGILALVGLTRVQTGRNGTRKSPLQSPLFVGSRS